MKTVKAELTKLKNHIKNEFQDNHLFLETFSLNAIEKEINELYPLLAKIELSKNTLEIIYTKRTSLNLLKKLNRLAKQREWNDFIELRFIRYLVELKAIIKQIYLLEVKGELRSEEELSALSSDLEKIKENLQQHTKLETRLKQDQETFESLKKSLKTLQTNYEESEEQAETIQEWFDELQPIYKDFIEYDQTAKHKLSLIATMASSAEADKPKIEKYKKEIEEMITLFKKQKDDIQEIIEDANRASMAGSFKKQADNINAKMQWANGVLIGSLLLTAGISCWGFETSFNPTENTFNWIHFFAKSAISLPLLVLAWLKAKEYSYLFRLREDYAYKYSSAMAFEGYKKQIQEQDPELQHELLQIAVDNLGSKPTKVFDKEINSTPLETIIDGVGKRIDKGLSELSKRTDL
ncbi:MULTISPECIES: hypothetical protein [Pasteurellaceae]|uniref:Uncharacterized protein n=3 Tax=Pasteurellaceae TaxID=712 RepID=A0A1H7V9Z4_9PAST|nr:MULTISPECIES: hypothetical protein [Pasteurella]MDP8051024.1 hypothetical protein [Pasteurella atlantica]MDP8104320.1 hypothetical protein [Pasteurella atlantica]MDP8147680.1 hypothetical protein [Pasteurella atlantica]QLB23348.1 hypothetical protein A6B44_09075 [Pasteurella skyensis]SEM05577.1 hypothetical protein SAMN05444853_10416 [Pasteurella skyensis]